MVCRQAFINIHGITSGRVQQLAYYAKTSPTPLIDMRGKQPNPSAKTKEVRQQIHQHIKSFPTIESHYGREASTKGRKFLSPNLSVAQMHDLYLKKFEPEVHAIMQRGEPAIPIIKYEYYLEYFKTNFNLSFGVPKTDTCATCDELDVKIDDEADAEKKQTLQGIKQAHIRESQQFYAEMRTCSAMAKENRNILFVSRLILNRIYRYHISLQMIYFICVSYGFMFFVCTIVLIMLLQCSPGPRLLLTVELTRLYLV